VLGSTDDRQAKRPNRGNGTGGFPLRELFYCLALVVLACLSAASVARAHDFYSSLVDPVTKGRCCGGTDCAQTPPGTIQSVPGGIRVKMTVEQAQRVNRGTKLPVDTFVPAERIILSPDGQWHLCVHYSDRQQPRGGILCIIGVVLI